MEGLVFLLRLVAILAAGALIFEVARRRGWLSRLTAKQAARPRQCPHLGMATDPFSHHTSASDEHRCYASMARERIDRAHQRQFCLASTYNRCPFLLVQTEPEGLLERIWAWRRIVSPVDQAQPSAVPAPVAAFLMRIAPIIQAFELAAEDLSDLQGATWRELLKATPRIATQVLRVARVIAQVMKPLIVQAARWLALHALMLVRQGRSAMTVAGSPRRSLKLGQRLTATAPKTHAAAHLQVLVAPMLHLEAEPHTETAAMPYMEAAPVAEVAQPTAKPEPAHASRAADLVARGVAAIEAGDEQEAHDLFKQATKRDPRAASAWFWRAKTANTLDEVISCLEQAYQLEPDNALIESNLMLATQRREMQRTTPAAVPVAAVAATAKPDSSIRRSTVVHRTLWAAVDVCRAVGALAALLIGATWLLSALPPTLRSAMAESSGLRSLPLPDMRALTGAVHLPIFDGYDAGLALPYGIAFLALFIGMGLLRDEAWTRLWGPLLGLGSAWAWLAFAAGTPEPMVVASCGLVAVAGFVTGWSALPGTPKMSLRSAHAVVR